MVELYIPAQAEYVYVVVCFSVRVCKVDIGVRQGV